MKFNKRLLCIALVVCLVLPIFALETFAATAPSVQPLSTDYNGMKVLHSWAPQLGFKVSKGTGDYTDIKMHVNVYKGYTADGSNMTTANRVKQFDWTPAFNSGETTKSLIVSYEISDCPVGDYTQELYVTYKTSSGTEKQTEKTVSPLYIIEDTCAGNHNWNVTNPKIDLPGSCHEEQLEHTTCSKCGAYWGYTVFVHQWNDGIIVVQPTCTEPGQIMYSCVICDESSEDLVIPALGHDFVNGVCTRCGEKEPVNVGTPVISLSNVAVSGKIKVTWEEVPGAVKYEVWRSAEKDGNYTRTYTTTKTNYTNTSAEAGETWYYKVRGVDANGNTGKFSTAKYRTCDLPQPQITATHVAATGKNKITWKEVPGAAKYEVYRSNSKTGEFFRTYTTTSLSYVNTSAKAGESWYYKVMAIHTKSAANSAFSEIKNLVCDLPRPEVTIALSSGHPKLSWKAIDGAVKYEIYRSTSSSSGYTKTYTTTKCSYTNTSATAGKTYYYKVIAVAEKSSANSAYSVEVHIKAK